ncbi:MAG: hypothetical protein P1T08_11990 [Acidimicrobiia bacterium]|nr:hypothetical protein [Acidimicrobiia bacterium]
MRRIRFLLPVLLVLGACGSSGVGSGESIGDVVMEAWSGGDPAAIERIYDTDVVMVLDGDIVAEDRQQITGIIEGAVGIGNTYQLIGSVTEYNASNGDLFVATLVEVVGAGHTTGDPTVGFYRVRDGKVIRHVFMDAAVY